MWYCASCSTSSSHNVKIRGRGRISRGRRARRWVRYFRQIRRFFKSSIVTTLASICDSVKSMYTKRHVYHNIPYFAWDQKQSYGQWENQFRSSFYTIGQKQNSNHSYIKPSQIMTLHIISRLVQMTDLQLTVYQALQNRFVLESKNIIMRLQELNRTKDTPKICYTF